MEVRNSQARVPPETEGASSRMVAILLRGTVIDSSSRTTLRILTDAVVGIDAAGRIVFVEGGHTEPLGLDSTLELAGGRSEPLAGVRVVTLPPRAFVVPGFVDTHTHAPQFAFTGLGYDLQLLDWLQKYTFPSETKFSSLEYAARVCHTAVRRTLLHGTTSCIWFATIHTDAAVQLGRIAANLGQRAFVGKVNMDRNAPETYCETTEESLAETERFVQLMLAEHDARLPGSSGSACGECRGPPAQPVITPRFVPTCSAELMRGLGAIAAQHGLLIQSHISENLGEIEWVRSLHPAQPTYAAVYDAFGLLGPRSVLAHGVYLGPEERRLFVERGAVVSHCPVSNCMLRSGMLNVRRLLSEGVAVALGTDVSGGAAPSMLSAIREALKVSNMVSLSAPEGEGCSPLTYPEAFWLATVGGARALHTDGVTGDFGCNAAFDAVIVDPLAEGSPIDLADDDGPVEAFQKWLQLGDDRNTAAVWVDGREVYNRADDAAAKRGAGRETGGNEAQQARAA